jgi:hypothetical protein
MLFACNRLLILEDYTWILLQTPSPVRGELVEPHLHPQYQLLTKQPFDKLRACPVMLKTR